jgi:hypothetical protein
MKKHEIRKARRLHLRAESLRPLATQELDRAEGGMTVITRTRLTLDSCAGTCTGCGITMAC